MDEYQTIVIDFDSTLIRGEALEMLAEIALEHHVMRADILYAIGQITERAMAGDMGFDVALASRLKLFHADKRDVAELIAVLQKEISSSVWQHREWFRQNSSKVYIVSGGFRDYIVPVVDLLGIAADHVYANHFLYDDDSAIIGFAPDNPLSRSGGKVAQLSELKLPRPLIIIGDGYTDYEVRAHGQADQFWAFTENITRPSVIAKADRVLAGFVAM